MIETIANFYGLEPQERQLMEECGELIAATNKYIRAASKPELVPDELYDAAKKLADELADVRIMIDQVEYLTGLGYDVMHIKMTKIMRQMKRMESEIDADRERDKGNR